jgi:Rrf2 family protein
VQVSARAEYAVRAAVELARLPAHRAISAERVAMQADLPAKFLEAILTDLRHAGLVLTQRGAQGGCRLARPADQITVADVFVAVEGPAGQVRGLDPMELTYPEGNESTRQLWIAAQTSLARIYGSVTLAQLADGRLPSTVARLASEG